MELLKKDRHILKSMLILKVISIVGGREFEKI